MSSSKSFRSITTKNLSFKWHMIVIFWKKKRNLISLIFSCRKNVVTRLRNSSMITPLSFLIWRSECIKTSLSKIRKKEEFMLSTVSLVARCLETLRRIRRVIRNWLKFTLNCWKIRDPISYSIKFKQRVFKPESWMKNCWFLKKQKLYQKKSNSTRTASNKRRMKIRFGLQFIRNPSIIVWETEWWLLTRKINFWISVRRELWLEFINRKLKFCLMRLSLVELTCMEDVLISEEDSRRF